MAFPNTPFRNPWVKGGRNTGGGGGERRSRRHDRARKKSRGSSCAGFLFKDADDLVQPEKFSGISKAFLKMKRGKGDRMGAGLERDDWKMPNR